MSTDAPFIDVDRPSLFTRSVTTKQEATFVKRKTSIRLSEVWPGHRAAKEEGEEAVEKHTQSERRARRERRRRFDQRRGERDIEGGGEVTTRRQT